MRKILIGALILILITGIALTVTNGISLGNMQISSVKQLEEKDKKLQQDTYNLKQMKEVTFSETMDELVKAAKELKTQRENYASLVTDSQNGKLNELITAEKYQVEYLWVKLGNYATGNDVTLKLNVLKSTTGIDGVYNLEFTLNGKYNDIVDFIYQVENDDTLGFRIEKFALVPTEIKEDDEKEKKDKKDDEEEEEIKYDTEVLTATFTVKEVSIDISSEDLVENVENTQESNTTAGNNTVTGNNTIQ